MPVISSTKVAAAAYAAGFRDELLVIMTAIAKAESSNDTDVYNGTCCYGLWQINKNAHKGGAWEEDWKNPIVNARMAKKIHASQGLKAWEVYTNQMYRLHMPAARRAVRRFNNAKANRPDKGGIADWIVDFLGIAGNVVPGGNPMGPNSDDTLSGQVAEKGLAGGFGSFFSLGVTKFFEWIADPKMWLRVSFFIAGGILLIVALLRLTGTDRILKDVASNTTRVKVKR